jgi:maltose/moltooligosaccharide transporter
MDASINVSMEPFRAFVGDNLPASQRTTGFATQSFFIGIGAVGASLLPWLLTNQFGVSNEAPPHMIPDSVRWSFYIGAAVFLVAVVWTVLKSREYSPEEMASFEENRLREEHVRRERSPADFAANGRRQSSLGWILLVLGAAVSVALYLLGRMATLGLAPKDVFQIMILSGGMGVVGGLLIFGGMLQRQGRFDNGFVTIINDFMDMPRTMKQLAWAQFFSWFALFAMWIYTTAAVTSHIYGTTDTTSPLYNDGANWVGVGFATYNGVAALVAFAIPPLARWSSPKVAHIICLLCGAAGLFSIYFVSNPKMFLGSMVGVGIAWASILAMPYAILTGSLPPSKLGYYMGVFNFFIVIPQIVAAALLGVIVGRFLGGQAIYALMIGAGSFVLAAVLMVRVQDKE